MRIVDKVDALLEQLKTRNNLQRAAQAKQRRHDDDDYGDLLTSSKSPQSIDSRELPRASANAATGPTIMTGCREPHHTDTRTRT